MLLEVHRRPKSAICVASMTESWRALTDLETGEVLRRPFAGHGWPVPRGIALKRNDEWWATANGRTQQRTGDRLLWSWADDEGVYCNLVQHRDALLREFLELAELPPSQLARKVARFALTRGVLGICEEHELIAGHASECAVRAATHPPSFEPVSAWQHYARQMTAVLNVLAKLRTRESGASNDWRVLLPTGRPTGPIDQQRFSLTWCVDRWLEWAGVRLGIEWLADRPELDVEVPSLFGALVVQLTLVLCGTRGLAVCSACSQPYTRSRQPKGAQSNYCGVCKARGEDAKRASRSYRARAKASRGSME